MTHADMETLLIEAINQVQTDSGRPQEKLGAETKPLSDIPDFDSLNAVEVVLYIEEKLGIELGINNVFVESDKELDIQNAVTRLLKKVSK